MNSPIQVARAYLNTLKWSIIPVEPKTKKPLVAWEKYQREFATVADLEHWFGGKTWEQVGLGVVTGRLSNIVVVDIDDTTGNQYGYSSPLAARTGRGGLHLYYRWDRIVGNKVKMFGNPVDLRGDGGFIVLPPSVHPSGNRYQWVVDGRMSEIAKELPPLPDEIYSIESLPSEPLHLDDIVGNGEGSRNDMLYKLACSLSKKPPKEVLLAVTQVNRTYDPPLSDKEVQSIVKSALKHNNWSEKILEKELPDEPIKPRSIASLASEIREMRNYEKTAASTGYPELDTIIRGFLPGHLITFTGETNSGKTTMAVNFAFNASTQNKKVLYIALEPDINIGIFFLALHLEKSFAAIAEEDLDTEIPNIEVLLQKDCPTLADLQKIISMTGERYDLIIIDHIGYFIPDSDNYIQKQSTIYKQLALYCKQKKNTILCIAHPRKTTKGANITMNDIAGSASAKQDSTEVLILHRDPIEQDGIESGVSDYAKLQVAKKKVSTPVRNTIVELVFSQTSPKVYSTSQVNS